MNKLNYLNLTILLLLVLTILSFPVNAFNVTTINGGILDWKESFCLQDPDDFHDLVGDDYYAYCESDFSEAYDSIKQPLALENITKLNELTGKNLTFEEESTFLSNETNLSNLKNADLLLDAKTTNNWQLFLGILGLVLLLVIFTLIIAHRIRLKKDEKIQITTLKPYLNTLRKKGYSETQIEHFLIKKGYDALFINKILNKK